MNNQSIGKVLEQRFNNQIKSALSSCENSDKSANINLNQLAENQTENNTLNEETYHTLAEIDANTKAQVEACIKELRINKSLTHGYVLNAGIGINPSLMEAMLYEEDLKARQSQLVDGYDVIPLSAV